jgi:hypothetical protein
MKSLQGAHRVHNLTRYGSLRAVRDIGALLAETIGVGIRWRRGYRWVALQLVALR